MTSGPIHPVSAVAGYRPRATDAEVGKNDLKRIRLLSVDLNCRCRIVALAREISL